jgi:serine/threonine protein kinase
MLGRHDFSGEILGGRYRLDRRIGCGAMATIYVATDQTTKGCVAVKVLHPEHDQNADLVRRFTQEGQLAAQICHPNLVPAHDLGWIGGRHYVVMQLVQGEGLLAMMKCKPLPWEQSVRLVLDLLAGLAALHARGVAHRDVSPHNCMIEPTDDGPRARLLDLGNARVIEETDLVLTQPEASETMSVYGTSRYIAPERLQGGPGDFRADVFSVGALWYTMITTRTLPDPLEADPRVPLEVLPLPRPLEAVLRGALDGPDRRHRSASSMAGAIRAALGVHTRRQAARRALWLVPLSGALVLPIWLALQTWSAACVDTPMRAAHDAPLSTPYASAHPSSLAPATQPQGIGEPKVSLNPGAVAAAIVDESAVVSDEESAVAAADEQPPPRFNLRAALARCKTHPTARLKIEYSPGRTVKINGQRPLGVVGRCVEDVLERHPPPRSITLTP